MLNIMQTHVFIWGNAHVFIDKLCWVKGSKGRAG